MSTISNRKIGVVFWFAFLGLFMSPAVRPAEIALSLHGDYCSAISVKVSGEIRKGDASRLKSVIDRLDSYAKRTFGGCFFPPTVWLDSAGGDVEESLKLGQVIRIARLGTRVGYRAKCFSACIFVLAGGVQRDSSGRNEIAIHRPYFSDIAEGRPIEEIRIARADLIKRIRHYLENMEISPALIDAMIAIPPNEMRLLEEADLQTFRSIGEDPSYEEYRVNRVAKLFSLRTADYRQLHTSAWEECEKTYAGDTNVCVNARILRIDIAEAQARRERLQSCRRSTKNEIVQGECFRKYMTRGEK